MSREPLRPADRLKLTIMYRSPAGRIADRIWGANKPGAEHDDSPPNPGVMNWVAAQCDRFDQWLLHRHIKRGTWPHERWMR